MIVGLAEFEMEPDAVTATPADLHEALFGPQPALFAHVADDAEHGVVGFSLWFLNYSTWLGRHGIYLEDLFVQPEHRGSGYGNTAGEPRSYLRRARVRTPGMVGAG